MYLHICRTTLSDGSHVFDVYLRDLSQIAAPTEEAALRFAEGFCDLCREVFGAAPDITRNY